MHDALEPKTAPKPATEALKPPQTDFIPAEELIESVRSAGFPLVGCVDLELARPEFQKHVARYGQWIDAGLYGNMTYLPRQRKRRADPTRVLQGAQSVLAVGLPYSKNPPYLAPGAPKHARYLQGEDYHVRLRRQLENALSDAEKRIPALSGGWKVCVDSLPVMERTWATLAGLGWIGKNTMLIHPQYGSYFLIGIALLTRRTGRGPTLHPDYCGHCTRCLEGCPTKAFLEPRWLDARRCISTLTLERHGPIEDPELRKQMGTWVAGCDTCQEVCPFNLKPKIDPLPHGEGYTIITDWERLENETLEEYSERTRHSALSRARPEDYKRNLEIARQNAELDVNASSSSSSQ